MQPLNTQILIQYEEPTEKKTEAGLYVPASGQADNALGFLRKGTVVAINPEEQHIMVGDTVLFNKNAMCYVPHKKHLKLVRSEDIYMICNKTESISEE